MLTHEAQAQAQAGCLRQSARHWDYSVIAYLDVGIGPRCDDHREAQRLDDGHVICDFQLLSLHHLKAFPQQRRADDLCVPPTPQHATHASSLTAGSSVLYQEFKTSDEQQMSTEGSSPL